jgi:hypothetical protein
MAAHSLVCLEPRIRIVSPKDPIRPPPLPTTLPAMRRVPRVDPPEIAPPGSMNVDEKTSKILDYAADTYQRVVRVEEDVQDVRQEVRDVKRDVINLQGDVGALKIRVDGHDAMFATAVVAKPTHRPHVITPPAPISLRPEDIGSAIPTGEFEAQGLEKSVVIQQAREAAEKQGNKQLEARFAEMMTQYERAVKSGRWDFIVRSSGKIVVAVAIAVAIAFVGVLGGALLQQAHDQKTPLEIPHH